MVPPMVEGRCLAAWSMLGAILVLALAGGPLACSSPGPAGSGDAGSPVPGSYTQTCVGCSYTATLLTCTGCYDSSGQQHQTSLPLPCDAGPANDEGQLVCPAGGTSSGDGGSTSVCAALANSLHPAQPTGGEQTCPSTEPVRCGTNTLLTLPCCCPPELDGTSPSCVIGSASYAEGCDFCQPNTPTYAVVCGLDTDGAPWTCPSGTACIPTAPFDPNTWPFACCPEGEQCTSLCH